LGLADSKFALFEVHQLPLKPVDERRLLGPIDRYFNVLAWPKHRPCNPALTS